MMALIWLVILCMSGQLSCALTEDSGAPLSKRVKMSVAPLLSGYGWKNPAAEGPGLDARLAAQARLDEMGLSKEQWQIQRMNESFQDFVQNTQSAFQEVERKRGSLAEDLIQEVRGERFLVGGFSYEKRYGKELACCIASLSASFIHEVNKDPNVSEAIKATFEHVGRGLLEEDRDLVASCDSIETFVVEVDRLQQRRLKRRAAVEQAVDAIGIALCNGSVMAAGALPLLYGASELQPFLNKMPKNVKFSDFMVGYLSETLKLLALEETASDGERLHAYGNKSIVSFKTRTLEEQHAMLRYERTQCEGNIFAGLRYIFLKLLDAGVKYFVRQEYVATGDESKIVALKQVCAEIEKERECLQAEKEGLEYEYRRKQNILEDVGKRLFHFQSLAQDVQKAVRVLDGAIQEEEGQEGLHDFFMQMRLMQDAVAKKVAAVPKKDADPQAVYDADPQAVHAIYNALEQMKKVARQKKGPAIDAFVTELERLRSVACTVEKAIAEAPSKENVAENKRSLERVNQELKDMADALERSTTAVRESTVKGLAQIRLGHAIRDWGKRVQAGTFEIEQGSAGECAAREELACGTQEPDGCAVVASQIMSLPQPIEKSQAFFEAALKIPNVAAAMGALKNLIAQTHADTTVSRFLETKYGFFDAVRTLEDRRDARARMVNALRNELYFSLEQCIFGEDESASLAVSVIEECDVVRPFIQKLRGGAPGALASFDYIAVQMFNNGWYRSQQMIF